MDGAGQDLGADIGGERQIGVAGELACDAGHRTMGTQHARAEGVTLLVVSARDARSRFGERVVHSSRRYESQYAAKTNRENQFRGRPLELLNVRAVDEAVIDTREKLRNSKLRSAS